MKNNKYAIWIALIAVLAMCLSACSDGAASGEPTVAAVNLAELLAPQRSQLLEAGETFRLELPENAEVTIASDNEKVATVDKSGLVTAVGEGMAFINVSDSDETVVCGVLVGGKGSMIDVTKLAAKEIFSDLELHSGTEIRGLAVDTENRTVYLSQSYGSSSYVPLNSDVLINKVEQKEDAWELTDWMRFSGSGKGSISIDNDGQTTRLWMECNGDYIGYGKAVTLVDWADNEYGLDSFGRIFKPQGIGSGMTLTVDPESDMVLAYDRAAKCYRVYNRAEMLAGEEAPEYVHSFVCKANQMPAAGEDDSQGRYNASIRGYALYDGYLYQFSGSSSIYLSVFDLEGNLQYCHRLEDLSEAEYFVPASIAVSEGKLYVVIASGNSEYNLANLLVFE